MLAEINEEIRKSLDQNGRKKDDCRLIAVSKRQSLEAVLKIFNQGQFEFGENYVQEGVEKIRQLTRDVRIRTVWHMIGPLQSNKAKLVAQHFDWVQTVTNLKTIQKLSQYRNSEFKSKSMNICIQVNIDGSSAKSGVDPDANSICELVRAAQVLPGIQMRGLMVMPDVHSEEEMLTCFDKAKILFDQVKDELGQECVKDFDTLSMGMSGDFQQAIKAGANMVRIGTAVFGTRT